MLRLHQCCLEFGIGILGLKPACLCSAPAVMQSLVWGQRKALDLCQSPEPSSLPVPMGDIRPLGFKHRSCKPGFEGCMRLFATATGSSFGILKE